MAEGWRNVVSKILHIVPGINDVANGMVVVARFLAKEQGDAEVVDLNHEIHKIHESDVEEVWVHGMWLSKEWLVCLKALRAGKRLVRMTHGSLSPVYLKYQSSLKKKLVSPIERYFLRKADKVIATCQAEGEWIRYYEPCVRKVEVTDLKRFFDLSRKEHKGRKEGEQLHLLYLGRRHPLKGVEYLESAVSQLNSSNPPLKTPLLLRIVSNAFGEEKEKIWDWCDVLVFPTLSENFGLVIAEALERGKRVITTDGAPAWSPFASATEDKGGSNGYGGRLVYLKGYRDGSPDERVALLKDAIGSLNDYL